MTRYRKIPTQAGIEPRICRSGGGRLNHLTNEMAVRIHCTGGDLDVCDPPAPADHWSICLHIVNTARPEYNSCTQQVRTGHARSNAGMRAREKRLLRTWIPAAAATTTTATAATHPRPQHLCRTCLAVQRVLLGVTVSACWWVTGVGSVTLQHSVKLAVSNALGSRKKCEP